MSSPHTRPHRLAIFNHKGGVGKTTLTVNIAAALARLGRRVLLVDADPQCNLTSYLVAEDVVDDLLDNSDGADGSTIWSAVKPLSEALGGVRLVAPIEPGTDGLYLLPGDIRLSEFELDLNDFWSQSLQRKPRGFRGTTALSELVTQVSEGIQADYVLYDSGPNIGPLNRVVLLDCDHFIVPVACDLFSLRALKTLGRTLVDWISDWRTIAELAPAAAPLLEGHPAFLGYIPEGFRVYGGELILNQADFLERIEVEMQTEVIGLLRDLDETLVDSSLGHPRLGEVKYFGALVPASQREGKSLYETTGGSKAQRDEASDAFAALAEEIDRRLNAAGGRSGG